MPPAFRKFKNKDRTYGEQYCRLFLKSSKGGEVRIVISEIVQSADLKGSGHL